MSSAGRVYLPARFLLFLLLSPSPSLTGRRDAVGDEEREKEGVLEDARNHPGLSHVISTGGGHAHKACDYMVMRAQAGRFCLPGTLTFLVSSRGLSVTHRVTHHRPVPTKGWHPGGTLGFNLQHRMFPQDGTMVERPRVQRPRKGVYDMSWERERRGRRDARPGPRLLTLQTFGLLT